MQGKEARQRMQMLTEVAQPTHAAQGSLSNSHAKGHKGLILEISPLLSPLYFEVPWSGGSYDTAQQGLSFTASALGLSQI